MTPNQHDAATRAKRIDTLMRIAGRSRESATRIDDQSLAACIAAMDAAERIVNESPNDERPFINTQMQLMLKNTLEVMIAIEYSFARDGVIIMAMGGTPEQQGKQDPAMPKKDLGQ